MMIVRPPSDVQSEWIGNGCGDAQTGPRMIPTIQADDKAIKSVSPSRGQLYSNTLLSLVELIRESLKLG